MSEESEAFEFATEPVDTGFGDLVTVAVTETPEPKGLTRDGIEATKALLKIDDAKITPAVLVAVARDMALDIISLNDILRKHGLTNAQYEFLEKHNGFFKQAVLQQAGEMQGLGSTQERLKAQAAAALELNLPNIAARMGRNTEDLKDVVEATKVLARIAGVDSGGPNTAGGGEKFTITIDLGADGKLAIGAQAPALPLPKEVSGREIRQIGKGAG